MQQTAHLSPQGLTDQAVDHSRAEHGRNILTTTSGMNLLTTVKKVGMTLVNRSFTQSVFQTLRVPNWMLWLMLGLTFGLLLVTLFIPGARQLFGFALVSVPAFGYCALAALVGVGWIEVYKSIQSRSIN